MGFGGGGSGIAAASVRPTALMAGRMRLGGSRGQVQGQASQQQQQQLLHFQHYHLFSHAFAGGSKKPAASSPGLLLQRKLAPVLAVGDDELDITAVQELADGTLFFSFGASPPRMGRRVDDPASSRAELVAMPVAPHIPQRLPSQFKRHSPIPVLASRTRRRVGQQQEQPQSQQEKTSDGGAGADIVAVHTPEADVNAGAKVFEAHAIVPEPTAQKTAPPVSPKSSASTRTRTKQPPAKPVAQSPPTVAAEEVPPPAKPVAQSPPAVQAEEAPPPAKAPEAPRRLPSQFKKRSPIPVLASRRRRGAGQQQSQPQQEKTFQGGAGGDTVAVVRTPEADLNAIAKVVEADAIVPEPTAQKAASPVLQKSGASTRNRKKQPPAKRVAQSPPAVQSEEVPPPAKPVSQSPPAVQAEEVPPPAKVPEAPRRLPSQFKRRSPIPVLASTRRRGGQQQPQPQQEKTSQGGAGADTAAVVRTPEADVNAAAKVVDADALVPEPTAQKTASPASPKSSTSTRTRTKQPAAKSVARNPPAVQAEGAPPPAKAAEAPPPAKAAEAPPTAKFSEAPPPAKAAEAPPPAKPVAQRPPAVQAAKAPVLDSDSESEVDDQGIGALAASSDANDATLASSTLPELKKIAKARGLKGYSKLKKSELIELLQSSSTS